MPRPWTTATALAATLALTIGALAPTVAGADNSDDTWNCHDPTAYVDPTRDWDCREFRSDRVGYFEHRGYVTSTDLIPSWPGGPPDPGAVPGHEIPEPKAGIDGHLRIDRGNNPYLGAVYVAWIREPARDLSVAVVDDVYGTQVGFKVCSDVDMIVKPHRLASGGTSTLCEDDQETLAVSCGGGGIEDLTIDASNGGHIYVLPAGPDTEWAECPPFDSPTGATSGGIVNPAGGVFWGLTEVG